MKRNVAYLSFMFVSIGVVAWAGMGQDPTSIPFVKRQATTPGTQEIGHINVSGTIIAGQHVGGGAGLTNVNAALLNGLSAPAFGRLGSSNTWTNSNIFQDSANIFNGNGNGLTSLNASRITAGTLNDLRLSSNVALLNDSQSFSGSNSFTGSNIFTGGFVTTAFQLTDSPTSGYVLKANSFGTGTWQPDGLTMPESDSLSGSGTGLAFTHTGTGDLSIFTINNASSVAEAVQGNSNNGGDVFQATMTGTGRAGYFAITNTQNTNPALFATTNGVFSGVVPVAIRGEATDTTLASDGIRGVSRSPGGWGVQGSNTYPSGNEGIGVAGLSTSPDGPTNGRPALASCSPGPCPMIMICACGSPSPQTTWVPVLYRSQRVQANP